ncbi:MAG: hypothetical protein ACRDMZ_06930 [Solirubrobacteraceae bacterium]
MIVIAHAGHWALDLLQLSPVIAIAGFAAWQSRSARRARRRTDEHTSLRA